MNLPLLSESDLLPHLAALNDLIAKGWSPTINILPRFNEWHVELSHTSLGTPMVTLHDGGQSSSWDDSDRSIHENCRVLGVALNRAIARAQEVKL